MPRDNKQTKKEKRQSQIPRQEFGQQYPYAHFFSLTTNMHTHDTDKNTTGTISNRTTEIGSGKKYS